jgi:hypothetical protein
MKRLKHPARLPSLALAVALVGVAGPRPARADEEGKDGRIVGLRLNSSSSAAHPSYHGSVTLKLVGSTTLVEYRWGGSSCPAQTLGDREIDVLVTAFVQRNRTKVTPTYIMGEAGTRCLVSFSLAAG